jgi:hypothetical protein
MGTATGPASQGGRGGSEQQADVVFVRADAGGAGAARPPSFAAPVDPATAATIASLLQADCTELESGAGDRGASGSAGAGPFGAATADEAIGGGAAALFDLLDPTPDVHGLFAHYNAAYFNGALAAVSVEWAPRMTLCAGTCAFSRVPGDAPRIRLSAPLLSLRPPSDLKNTLLHEMVHAAIFLSGQRDAGDHGPLFMAHAARINAGRKLGGPGLGMGAAGAAGPPAHDPVRPPGGYRIEAYHAFHAEVDSFRVHHWRCDGACGTLVKRASNRPPQPADCVRAGRRRRGGGGGEPCNGRGCWWHGHSAACGGAWVKVAGPPPKEARRKQQTAAAAGTSAAATGRRRGAAVAGTGPGQGSLHAFFKNASGGGGGSGSGGGGDAPRPPPPAAKRSRSRSPTPVIVVDSDDDGDEPGEGPIVVLSD